MAETVKPRRGPRGPRADYQKKFNDIVMWARVTKDAINAYVPDGESKNGQLLAINALLKRLGEPEQKAG